MIAYGKVDLTPLGTHRRRLDDIAAASAVFQERHNGALKIVLTP